MRSACFILILLFTAVSADALADRRVALVMGNSAYQNVPGLPNPKNDASDMTAKLKDLGFEVVTGLDLDLVRMRGTVRDFIKKLDRADIALFYYSGHGLQVNGNNYIAPVDAHLSSYDDLDFETLPMDLVLAAMERSSKVNLVFLDACRDNPLAENLARSMGTRSGSVGRGLAKLGSGVGSLIAFATQPGNVAFDGSGRNSPFTTALLRHLGTPGEDITRDLVHVRRDVLEATYGKQVPWDNSSLTGDVVLNPLPIQEPKADFAPTPVPIGPNNAVEIAYWETIKDSADKSFFQAYLQQYPNGAFKALAKLKIDAINSRVDEQRQANERQKAERVQGEPVDKSPDDVKTVARLEHPDPEVSEDSGELALSTQRELARIGCLTGQVDGKWGAASQKALINYAKRQGIKLASVEPTGDLLKGLKTIRARVCPLFCADGMEAREGRCESAGATGLSAFDGRWALTRRATNSLCGWRELTADVSIKNGKIYAPSWEGKIASDGTLRIIHRFVHEGKKGSNILNGKIKGNRGRGKFYHVGGECAGIVEINKM
ncbi:caspase domain-containing protein [Mesorhizobium amorphae]|uniref:caspase family protein n=1 Tax=Mesorhizobium amorphae TaxID=71433 RepID=UPI003ED14BFA